MSLVNDTGDGKLVRFANCFHHKWADMVLTDTGDPLSLPTASDKTVHVYGTFDGAVFALQGTNEEVPANWATLHNAAGDALQFTSDEIQIVVENCRWLRPVHISGGTGSTSVSFELLSRV